MFKNICKNIINLRKKIAKSGICPAPPYAKRARGNFFCGGGEGKIFCEGGKYVYGGGGGGGGVRKRVRKLGG